MHWIIHNDIFDPFILAIEKKQKNKKLAVIVLIEIILENMRKIVKDGETLIRTPKQLSFKYFDIICFVGKLFFKNFNFEITKPYVAGGQFGQYKMMQKTWKMPEILAYRYSSESEPYQHHNVQMVFKNLCILVLWTKVASALEGLIISLNINGSKHEHDNIIVFARLSARCG